MSDRTTQRPTASRRPRQRASADASPWKGLQEKWRRLLDSPQLDYKVIVLVTGILVALGLMISLSSSMVTSRGADGSGSVFAQFLRQAVIVLVGLAVMWGALWVSP
jgi:cell division protein FtsW